MDMQGKTITDADVRYIKNHFRIATSILIILVLMATFVFPIGAYADNNPVNLPTMIGSLKTIVTVVLLPVGILIAGWRIVYLGVFCAMAGIDPLGIMNGSNTGDGSVSAGDAVAEIKQQLSGFIKGLCWVGGVWIVFQLALTVAQMFAGTLQELSG